jgi:hypothetical protein
MKEPTPKKPRNAAIWPEGTKLSTAIFQLPTAEKTRALVAARRLGLNFSEFARAALAEKADKSSV